MGAEKTMNRREGSTMAEYVFRVLPEHEPSAELLAARRIFESYGGSVQSMKVQTGIGAISGAYAGSKGGIPGAVIGAALGALTSYWKSKSSRMRVYAQLDAMGLLKKPQVRYRGTWELHNSKFLFLRLPYAEQTALVILPIMQRHYPAMTDAQLTARGQAAQRALIKFRQEHTDIPLALAVEVILLYSGIARNDLGEYDLIRQPLPGEHFPPPGDFPVHALPPLEANPNYLLYVGLAVGGVLLFQALGKTKEIKKTFDKHIGSVI